MSIEDETAPVVTDEAPVAESAAPGETEAPAGPPEGFIDQQRYEELRREFNQRNNLIDRARQGDPAALQELTGYTFAEDDEEPEPEENGEEEFRDPRVDQLLQQQEQEQARKFIDGVSGDIGNLLSESKIELPEALREGILPAVFAAAGDQPLTRETTQQVVQKWTAAIGDIEKRAVEKYLATKRNAPFVNPGGTGATEVPNLDDGPARRQWMAEKLAAAEALG